MIQAVFYTMVVNETLELGVLSKALVEDLKSALVGLRWFNFKAWLQLNMHVLLWAHRLKPADPGTRPRSTGGQEESLRSNDTCHLLVMTSSHRLCCTLLLCFVLLFCKVALQLPVIAMKSCPFTQGIGLSVNVITFLLV